MTRLFATLALAATLAIAVASGTVTVNDTNFDYSDTDIETAYVQLDYADGQLELIFADAFLDGSLPGIVTSVPEPVAETWDGEDILPEFTDLGNIEMWKAGRDFVGFTIVHEDTALDEVVDSYLAVMSDLGFDATLDFDVMNTTCYMFSQDGETVRAIFDNDGYGTVSAYLRF